METAKLKNLAKSQMKGKTSILIFSNLIFSILTMIVPIIQLISNNELNSITKFTIMTIVQPLFLGIAYIHYNCTIEGRNVGILDLFYGYKVKLFRQGIVYIVRTFITYLMTSSLVTLTTTIIMIIKPNQVLIPIIMAIIIFISSLMVVFNTNFITLLIYYILMNSFGTIIESESCSAVYTAIKVDNLEKYRKDHKGFTLQRYKGLGEMDADQLWETTLNPETRILKQVEIEDARLASEVTEMLMGNNVGPRRDFIYEHATDAELDI